MDFDALLAMRGRLERGAVVEAAEGEEITWTLAQDRIPCLVRPARPPADLRLGVEQTVTHIIYTRPITALQDAPDARWRLHVDGIMYRLIDPHNAAARGHHLEIRARRQ